MAVSPVCRRTALAGETRQRSCDLSWRRQCHPEVSTGLGKQYRRKIDRFIAWVEALPCATVIIFEGLVFYRFSPPIVVVPRAFCFSGISDKARRPMVGDACMVKSGVLFVCRSDAIVRDLPLLAVRKLVDSNCAGHMTVERRPVELSVVSVDFYSCCCCYCFLYAIRDWEGQSSISWLSCTDWQQPGRPPIGNAKIGNPMTKVKDRS